MLVEITKADTLAWRRFLNSESGLKGLLLLRELTPSIQKGLPHDVQFDAGVNQGYIKCLDKINELLVLRKEKEENLENP